MASFRTVTETFSTAAQLAPEDLERAAELGFVQVINNRPDGEEPGQPSAADMARAAADAGLAYAHLPIRGLPSAEQARAMGEALEAGPTLAFCRSGTRSIAAWALAEAQAGRRTPAEIVDLCARAGYDMSGLFSR